MHPGDQSTIDETTDDTPTLQATLFPLPRSHPLPIREFLPSDQPRHRLAHQGASALSDAELLAVITGVPCLETAQRLLIAAGGATTCANWQVAAAWPSATKKTPSPATSPTRTARPSDTSPIGQRAAGVVGHASFASS
jgi:hypothetical protein